jgi:hypothetical protein
MDMEKCSSATSASMEIADAAAFPVLANFPLLSQFLLDATLNGLHAFLNVISLQPQTLTMPISLLRLIQQVSNSIRVLESLNNY